MKRGHLTDVCDHAEAAWCLHCEEGCEACGALEEIQDSGLCDKCETSRLESYADATYERMKYGD